MSRVSTKPIIQYTVRCSLAQVRAMLKIEFRNKIVDMSNKYVPVKYRGTELAKWYALYTFTVAGEPNILEWYNKFDIVLDKKTFVRAKSKAVKASKSKSIVKI